MSISCLVFPRMIPPHLCLAAIPCSPVTQLNCERSLRRRAPVPESNFYKRLKVSGHFRHCDFNCGASTLGPERLLLDGVMCIGYFRLLSAGRLTATCHSTFANHLPFRTSSPLHSFPAAPLFCRYPSVQVTMHPSEQIPMVNTFSLTRFRLSGTNSLFLSDILPLSVLLNLP